MHQQVTWGGRWQEGSAYTIGEEVEQTNGYISRLGSTTKYMNAAGIQAPDMITLVKPIKLR